MMAIAPEMILLALVLVQLLLLGSATDSFGDKLFLPSTYIGYIAALALSPIFWKDQDGEFFYGALRNDALFHVPRALVIVGGIVLLRMIAHSTQVVNSRRRELVFLVTLNLLLSALSLLSNTLLMSYLCAIGLAFGSAILVSVNFRSRKEVEGSHKLFFFSMTGILLAMAATVFAVLVAGQPTPQKLWMAFAALGPYGTWLGPAVCFSPLLLLAGLFPFHFVTVDRDHAAPWPIQAHLMVHVGGVLALSFLRLVVMTLKPGMGTEVPLFLRAVGYLALLGALVSLPPCFTQENLKRAVAYLGVGLWAFITVSATLPSSTALAGAVYWFSIASLGILLLSWGLQSIAQAANDESFAALSHEKAPHWGVWAVFSGVLFLFPLPPAPGFGAFLLQVGPMLERQSSGQLLWLVAIVLCLSLALGRFVVVLLRQIMCAPRIGRGSLGIAYADWGLLGLSAAVGALIGCRWELFFSLLLRQANAFIVS